MDNLTHSLVGWTLGRTGLKDRTRKGMAALILGANAADIDVFFGWVPWAPLAIHRGVTHSLVAGLIVLPPLLAGLLWLWDRWQVKRGKDFTGRPEVHFGWLLALSYIGCATHPLLDWQTSYAIQLFSPFSNRWYHADTLFIVDPWIWLMLGWGIWLSRRREKGGLASWRRPAVAALAALALYISANGVLTAFAWEAPRVEAPHAKPDTEVVSPTPVLFWRRSVIWRRDHQIWRGDYDPFHSLRKLEDFTGPVPDGMTDPLARRALMEPTVRSFRRWSILPMAWVTRQDCEVLVRFQDARFGMRPGAGPLGESATLPDPKCATATQQ